MDQQKLLETLISYLDMAFRRGAYGMAEAEELLKNVEPFKVKTPDSKPTSTESERQTALNMLVQFLDLAFSRGAFRLTDAEKIVELVNHFKAPETSTPPTNTPVSEQVTSVPTQTRSKTVPLDHEVQYIN